MNSKYFGMLVATSVGCLSLAVGVGCGDSSSTGGAGGTGSTSSSTSSTTTSSSSSKAATGTGTGTGTGTASTGTGMTCTQTCESMHQSGYMILEASVIKQCGCTTGGPCATQCMNDAACANPPGAPTGACDTCLQMEAAKGAGSACSLTAATTGACKADADCSALVTCILQCP